MAFSRTDLPSSLYTLNLKMSTLIEYVYSTGEEGRLFQSVPIQHHFSFPSYTQRDLKREGKGSCL
jgi:hypothetical protein